jgi:hypothetical protein
VIPLLLMLAAADAPAMTPVEAERAFAADAQTIGQWTAFRKWSTDDATMFVPQPVKAHEFLKDRKDPPKAIDWWPTASWISCDGKLAVNTGGWKTPDGSVGYFSTVWAKQADGSWKWIVDGGDDLKVARSRPRKLTAAKASCGSKPPKQDEIKIVADAAGASGHSDDGTLIWYWNVSRLGRRVFAVSLWNGRAFAEIINDRSPASK